MEVARFWETDMGIKRTFYTRLSRLGEENCYAVAQVDTRNTEWRSSANVSLRNMFLCWVDRNIYLLQLK